MPSTVHGFDLGDTLLEYAGLPLSWEAQYPVALAGLAAHLQGPAEEPAIASASEILRRFNTRLHPRVHEIAFSTIAAEIASCWGVAAPAEERPAAEAFFRCFRQRLRALPDAIAVLGALRDRGELVGIFTDVPYGMPRELVLEDLAAVGLQAFPDNLVTSRQAGFRKPHPGALTALAAQLQCPVEAMTYVGNEKKDIDAARAVGCRGVLLWPVGEPPAWGQAMTIRSLRELIAPAGSLVTPPGSTAVQGED
jgi:putative hydrolase of the HAD superfamily